jgi:hypothetical protein
MRYQESKESSKLKEYMILFYGIKMEFLNRNSQKKFTKFKNQTYSTSISETCPKLNYKLKKSRNKK